MRQAQDAGDTLANAEIVGALTGVNPLNVTEFNVVALVEERERVLAQITMLEGRSRSRRAPALSLNGQTGELEINIDAFRTCPKKGYLHLMCKSFEAQR